MASSTRSPNNMRGLASPKRLGLQPAATVSEEAGMRTGSTGALLHWNNPGSTRAGPSILSKRLPLSKPSTNGSPKPTLHREQRNVHSYKEADPHPNPILATIGE